MACDSRMRDAQIQDFLRRSGWGAAARFPLGQDASTRRYERLVRSDGQTALLMDAPPVEDAPCPPTADEATRLAMGWNAATRLAASRVEAYVALAGELRSRGLSAPDVYAHDRETGLALVEDFGTSREFARLIERGAADEVSLYEAAAETLARLHAAPPPEAAHGHGETWPILTFDRLALATNADLFIEWVPRLDGRARVDEATRTRWAEARDALIDQAMGFPRAFTLRDYHAENLIWLPQRAGVARVGLLDFQDAVLGWDAWDLAMLTQDARRPVSPAAREAALTRYLDGSGVLRADLDARLAVIGALNALRIAGVFARLVVRDDKPRYRAFLPRQVSLLAVNLAHPAAADMAALVREIAPFVFEEPA